MIRRQVPVWVAIAFASAATAFAEPPANIYVTTGAGRHVLAIPIDPSTGTQGGPVQVLATADAPVSDITQKSDLGLFYATSRAIWRVGQAAPVAEVAGAQELRFSAYGCLFYNSAGGVNSVACGNAAPAGGGGRGLALDLFGNLLAISGTTVVRIPLDPAGNKGAPVTLVGSGLAAPSGIAVASGRGTNGLERGDFVVLDGADVRLFNGKTGALKNAHYASVPKDQTLNFADFDAEDRLWLASMMADDAMRSPNGRVFRADAGNAVCADSGGTNCALVSLLLLDGKYWPAVGLALGPSSRQLTRAIAPIVPNLSQSFAFDFGSSIIEIRGTVLDACELQVRSSLTPAPAAVELVSSPQYAINPYLGDEGFPTVYRIELVKGGKVVNADACFDVVNRPAIFVAALTSSERNPRILRCEPGCEEIELDGWWHTGPIDDDGEGGGRIDDFSDWLIVDKAVAPPSEQIRLCHVKAPIGLTPTGVVAPGSSVSLKLHFSLPGQPCGSQFLADPNAQFLVALSRIEPDHARKSLTKENERPIMTFVGTSYFFELRLKDASGVNFENGTYEITVTDVTPGGTRLTPPVLLYFRIGS